MESVGPVPSTTLRRLQERFKKILGPWQKSPPRLYYETEWPRTDEGGLEKIDAWIKAVPNPRLIVIDVLARIRSLQQGRAPQCDIDYQIVASLQKIASERRIAIVVVTHVRKSGSESGDAIDKISGTLGLSGAADSFMVLDRDGQGVTLYTRGRDIEEISVALTFNSGRCRWTVLGQAGEVRKSDERRLILDALNGSSIGITRADIVAATEMKSNNVGVLLNKMMKPGEIMRAINGCNLTTTPDNTVTAVTGTQQIFAPASNNVFAPGVACRNGMRCGKLNYLQPPAIEEGSPATTSPSACAKFFLQAHASRPGKFF